MGEQWRVPTVGKARLLDAEFEVEIPRYGKPTVIVGYSREQLVTLRDRINTCLEGG